MYVYEPLKFVESIAFPRFGGTAEEKRAAEIIKAETEKMGGCAVLEEFTVPASEYKSHCAKVIAPFEMDLNVVPFQCCGTINKDLKLMYAERCVEMDLIGIKDLSDTVVMINQLNIDAYKLLAKLNAAAIFVVMGKYYHETNADAGMYERPAREKYLEYATIPTFFIHAREATDILRNGAEMLHVELDQVDGTTTSQNVVATIEGTELPDEHIVVTGHYDSLTLAPGAWDNATGSAAVMGIYNYFLANKPKRTMHFIWCGTEEQGLLGSKGWIEKHEDIMDMVKFCFNFDMCGTILGPNNVFVTGTKELEDFAELFCKEQGYSAQFRKGVHSSDSAPFADKGVPGIGLSRGTQTSEIHTSRDTMFPLGEKQLKMNIDFANKMISRVVNSAVLPVEKGMPDNIKKELDKYFQRDK